MRIEAVSWRKQTGRGVDRPLRCSAEVKIDGKYTSTLFLYLHSLHEETLTFICAEFPQNVSIPEQPSLTL